MARTAIAPLAWTICSVVLAQGPIERERFIQMAMAICDHDAMAPAFTMSDRYEGLVLFVQFPKGVSGVHPEEMFDLVGRHGRIVFAHRKYVFFLMVKHWLELQDLEVSMDRASGFFRTYNHVDAEAPIPIVKGSVALDGPGARGKPSVRLLKRIPSDRAFMK